MSGARAGMWGVFALGVLVAAWCALGIGVGIAVGNTTDVAINAICLPINIGYAVWALRKLRQDTAQRARITALIAELHPGSDQ